MTDTFSKETPNTASNAQDETMAKPPMAKVVELFLADVIANSLSNACGHGKGELKVAPVTPADIEAHIVSQLAESNLALMKRVAVSELNEKVALEKYSATKKSKSEARALKQELFQLKMKLTGLEVQLQETQEAHADSKAKLADVLQAAQTDKASPKQTDQG